MKPALVDCGILGKRSLAAEHTLIRSPHAIADAKSAHARSDSFDRARQIAADDERQRDVHLHGAAADVSVDRIERRCRDLNQNLPRGWLWLRKFPHDDTFRRAGL